MEITGKSKNAFKNSNAEVQFEGKEGGCRDRGTRQNMASREEC